MGLFGSLLGSPSSSYSGSSSVSGYGAMPAFAQQGLQNLAQGIGNINSNYFTPLAITPDEQSGFERIRQGFAPTQQSIQSDISMQQNPYNQYVIDEINRQSQGGNSVLQQNLNSAGQFGSNRSVLGANDVDLSRQNQIGGFLQSQYNTSLNNAMTTLPALRAADAQGLLGIGQFDRDIYTQNTQAPLSALSAQAGLFGNLGYTAGGSNSQSSSVSKGESKGILGGLTSAVGNLWSDERLKDNVIPFGTENGHKVYKYSYKGSDKEWIGVMAQEVEKINPLAVNSVDGFLSVNYDLIGVNFREAA